MMETIFIEYPACSTCKKAKKYLKDHDLPFTDRHIVEDTPSVEELSVWWKRSGLELKKWFNTSGMVYKELQLKDKLKDMSEEEQLQLLSSNGMLIKRPILVTEDIVYIGFKEENYKKLCSE